jgi:hypothetical protein
MMTGIKKNGQFLKNKEMRRIPLNRLKTNFLLNCTKNTFLFSPNSAQKPTLDQDLSFVTQQKSVGQDLFSESMDDF